MKREERMVRMANNVREQISEEVKGERGRGGRERCDDGIDIDPQQRTRAPT